MAKHNEAVLYEAAKLHDAAQKELLESEPWMRRRGEDQEDEQEEEEEQEGEDDQQQEDGEQERGEDDQQQEQEAEPVASFGSEADQLGRSSLPAFARHSTAPAYVWRPWLPFRPRLLGDVTIAPMLGPPASSE